MAWAHTYNRQLHQRYHSAARATRAVAIILTAHDPAGVDRRPHDPGRSRRATPGWPTSSTNARTRGRIRGFSPGLAQMGLVATQPPWLVTTGVQAASCSDFRPA
jgi:hypothetical protein